ncbi:MAG: aspartyl protease family protein [Candidatus Obscuribacterales bacterium]|nr:aspartyl protease family protein [Candidatus Obscuribacterales bacterium]
MSSFFQKRNRARTQRATIRVAPLAALALSLPILPILSIVSFSVFLPLADIPSAYALSESRSKSHEAVKLKARRDGEAVKLAEKVLAKLGGYEAYKKFNDKPCRATGKIVQTSALSKSTNSFGCDLLVKREKEMITISLLGQPHTTVYDGKICWTKQGDTVMPADAITAKRIEEDINHGLLLLESIPEASLELGKPVVIAGRPCETLMIYANDGIPTSFYIDKENYLVLGSSYPGVDLERGIKIDKLYHYEDYREVEGTMQPFVVKEFSGKELVSETRIDSIKIDETITDADFAMPEEKLPLRLQAGPVTIPFDYVGNEILVRAKINGTSELKFILDTGATQSILDKRFMKELSGLAQAATKPEDSIAMTTGAGSIKADGVKFNTFTLGDMELKDVTCAVADLSGFETVQKEKPAGLIGANVLKRFLVTVDYENGKVTFDDPRKSKVADGAIIVNTKPSLGMSGLAVEGSFDGKQKVSFLLDTGAAFNNVSESRVKSLIPNPLYRTGQLKGLDGKLVETGSVKFNYLELDNLRIDGPVFSVAPGKEGSQQTGIITSSDLAIIGNPLLSRYKVTFDYRNQRLILSQSKSQKSFWEYQNKLAPIRLELLKSRNLGPTIRELEKLADAAHNKELFGAEALVRIELAQALCQKAGGDFSPDFLFRPLTSQLLSGAAAGISSEHGDREHVDLKTSPKVKEKAGLVDKPLDGHGEGREKVLEDAEAQLLKAYNLAESSRDKSIQARVLAVWGFLYASQNPSIDYLNSAKQKISKAVLMAPTDPEVLAYSGYFLARLESSRKPMKVQMKAQTKEPEDKDLKPHKEAKEGKHSKESKEHGDKGQKVTVIRNLEDLGRWLVDQIVDQAIMIDPSNWLALSTKLERAKQSGKFEDVKVIQTQLKHYYPDVKCLTQRN